MEGWITTVEFAQLHGVSVQKIDRLITNGHLKYRRVGHYRYIHRDTPMIPRLVAPVGHITVAEYCKRHKVPRTAVDRQIQLGRIPYIQRHNKERWIREDLQFVQVPYKTKMGYLRQQWTVAS